MYCMCVCVVAKPYVNQGDCLVTAPTYDVLGLVENKEN